MYDVECTVGELIFEDNKLMFYHPKTRPFAASIIMMSREQRLITKEYVATYTNLFLWFNPLNTQAL